MKRTELEELIRETIAEILSEAGTYAGAKSVDDMKKDPDFNTLNAQAKIDAEKKLKSGGSITVGEAKNKDDEDEFDAPEKEPSKSELKKNASVAKITDALAKVVKDFKATNEEYKKAEGDKKKDLLDKLKDLTEKKKKLEKALKEKEAKL